MIRPSDLLRGVFLNTEPVYFAVYVSSHCPTPSLRERYLNELIDQLGSKRVHRYGSCGNRQLPPPPIQNAYKLLAQYKL